MFWVGTRIVFIPGPPRYDHPAGHATLMPDRLILGNGQRKPDWAGGRGFRMHKLRFRVSRTRLPRAAIAPFDRKPRQNPCGYAAADGPNQVVSASASPGSVKSPTQATYP